MSEDVSAVFTVKRFGFLAQCEKVLPVIGSGDTAMSCFLVDIAPGQITVTGSDLELVIQATSTSIATDGSAALAIPAKRLLALLKEAPEGDIAVEVAGAKATVTAGVVSWDLALKDPADFTRPPAVASVKLEPVKRDVLLTGLKSVRHAICKDGSRLPLMMVDILANAMTASDGGRLQRYVLDFPVDMKIPAAAVPHLLRLLASSEAAEIKVGEHEGYLVFQVGTATFIARKTMARFPDQERLIVKPALLNHLLLRVDRRSLLQAVARVQVNADAETAAIGLRLTRDKVTVTSRDKDGNGAEQAVDAWWKDDDRLLVVNHVFLTQMLEVWPYDACHFWLGPDAAKKKSLVVLSDKQDEAPSTQLGIINQLHAAVLGNG